MGTIPVLTVNGAYTVYGYTEAKFRAIADGLLALSGSTAPDFGAVYDLINDANAARAAVDEFITNYNAWSQNNVVNLIGDAPAIAKLLADGSSVDLSTPTTGLDFWNLLADAFDAAIDLIPDPAAQAGVVFVYDLLDHSVKTNPTSPNLSAGTDSELTKAATDLEDAIKTQFTNAVDTLVGLKGATTATAGCSGRSATSSSASLPIGRSRRPTP